MSAPKGVVFLVGVGGMGMAPLALYMKGEGWDVRGHDDHLSPPVRLWLDRAGIPCAPCADVPENCVLLVRSSAVSLSHPLCVQAAEKGIEIVRRGECWARRVRDKLLVAIVGSHGKTTTTAILVHLLEKTKIPFSYLIGGLPAKAQRPPARFNADARWVVSEIDESDGTIQAFSPEITLALNFDWDHPDCYRDEAALERMFSGLFARTRGTLIVPEGCPRLSRLAVASGKPVVFFKEGEDFNQTNAAAAGAVVRLLAGVAPQAQDLKDFDGIRRRQDILLRRPRLTVVADYAHHPTEISALMKSMRRRDFTGQLWVVFQPHRFTRTRQYAAAFGRALKTADAAWLLPVYPASEPPLEEGTHRAILERWPENGPQVHETTADTLTDALVESLQKSKDPVTLAFVGAGDIEVFADRFIKHMETDFFAALLGTLSPDTVLKEQEPLATKTTFRIGGDARWYAEPANRADLGKLLREAAARDIPTFILGRGSNTLVPDEGFDGLVIHLASPDFEKIETLPDGRVVAGAGARLKQLCASTASAGLSGFEPFEGIPASVGGALRMNAGAFATPLYDRVESVEIMDFSGEIKTFKRDELHPVYRCCPEVAEAVALSATFLSTEQKDPQAVRDRMEELAKIRRASQPREPSAGCVFKNPPGTSAGKLVDEAGLKDTCEGGAKVSPVHANFIVNASHARSADVVALMRRVRARVKETQGIELSPEIRLLGKNWEDVL